MLLLWLIFHPRRHLKGQGKTCPLFVNDVKSPLLQLSLDSTGKLCQQNHLIGSLSSSLSLFLVFLVYFFSFFNMFFSIWVSFLFCFFCFFFFFFPASSLWYSLLHPFFSPFFSISLFHFYLSLALIFVLPLPPPKVFGPCWIISSPSSSSLYTWGSSEREKVAQLLSCKGCT